MPEDKKEADNKANASHDANNHKPTIVIKRIKKVVKKHHGGAWKIAYADFVTAMMTFFLLLWLLSMLNKYQLEGISAYFKQPIKTVIRQNIDPKMDKVKNENTITTSQLTPPKSAPDKDDIEKDEQTKKQLAASEMMKKDLENQLNTKPELSEFKNSLNFVVLAQGLKIELKDLENKAMFSSGKTDFGKYAKRLLSWLGPALNKYPNRIMIVGHTDNKPFGGEENYTNWELSADRSNATRRELIKSGMFPERIVRVVGAADVDKLDTAADDQDPANRRIAIIILTDDAYNKMKQE